MQRDLDQVDLVDEDLLHLRPVHECEVLVARVLAHILLDDPQILSHRRREGSEELLVDYFQLLERDIFER